MATDDQTPVAASASELQAPSEAEIMAIREAEHEVEREAWNVHCIEFLAEKQEAEAAGNRVRAAEARRTLATKQRVLDALAAKFPEVELQEVDLHGVT